MRQVRDDELLYHLYDATRGWMASLRKAFADYRSARHELSLEVLAAVLADKFRYYSVYQDAGGNNPLSHTELAAVFATSMRGWRRSLQKDFAAADRAVQERARYTAALVMYEDLAGYQFLIDTLEPPPFNITNFTGGSGVSGVPAVADTIATLAQEG